MNKDELDLRFSSLHDLLNSIQQNVNLNFTVTWAALAFVVAASGWALWVLSRSWTEKAVSSKLEMLKNEIRNEVLNEINIATGKQTIYSSNIAYVVTFPKAYKNPPFVTVTPLAKEIAVVPTAITTTGFQIYTKDIKPVMKDGKYEEIAIDVLWVAIPKIT